jgi:DNA topoisomerase-1
MALAIETIEKLVDKGDDPAESAREAGLRYVTDEMPGIVRKRSGKGFTYIGPDGKPVRDDEQLKRIRALAVPPAWTDVWICADPRGHIQATGRDDRGRKQYRYHPRWREVRDETKYGRMVAFGDALPTIRKKVAEDLAKPGLRREKVLAAVIRLLETTLIRVGNDEYAKSNHSYGLTTLRDRHVEIDGSVIRFEFEAKGGKRRVVDLRDRTLARIVQRCRDLPGYELFQYVDEGGERRTVGSDDVNEYLREITGQEFSAKDFRTWTGTVLAALALAGVGEFTSQRQAKKNVVRAIEEVADRLGNTPVICRKSYVHPAVIEAYLEGSPVKIPETVARATAKPCVEGLSREEKAVLSFLRRRLKEEQKRGAERLEETLRKSVRKVQAEKRTRTKRKAA